MTCAKKLIYDFGFMNRKFRPFYAQTLSFPMMIYSGKYSPFELLIPRQSGRSKDEDPSKDNFRYVLAF